MPAIPSFYHHPKTIDDLVTQYVCRVLGQLGLPQSKQFAWTGQNAGMNAAQDEVHDEVQDEVQELGNGMEPSARKVRSV